MTMEMLKTFPSLLSGLSKIMFVIKEKIKDIEFAAFADYLNAFVFICFYRWWLNWESKEPFGGGSFGILRSDPNIRIAWKLNTV